MPRPESSSSSSSSSTSSPSSTVPGKGLAPYTLQESAQLCWSAYVSGLRDAIDPRDAFLALLTVPSIQAKTVRCFCLNVLLFLGSMALFHWGLLPTLRFLTGSLGRMLNVENADQGMATRFLESCMTALYYLGWVYPIYCVSFVLNAIWYQEIADAAFFRKHGARPKQAVTYAGFVNGFADEVFRAFLFANYFTLTFLVSLIPYIGPGMGFLMISWISAYYSFEYNWINQQHAIEVRVDYFETHWAYFAGFGTPVTILTGFLPTLVSAGLFAIIFPILIIMATGARPLPRQADRARMHPLLQSMPVFYLARKANLLCIRRLRRSSSSYSFSNPSSSAKSSVASSKAPASTSTTRQRVRLVD